MGKDTDDWKLSDYADQGKNFDEVEYEAQQQDAAEARKQAISEYDAISSKVDQDFGFLEPQFKSTPEHAAVDPAIKMPFDVSGVDLLSPPGFAGQVVDWIDSQCRYPRRRLAVASGICALGNIGGMSHVDAHGDVTANMLAFCVAASSTGKEAVMQAFSDLHIAAGVHGALQGGIKSEQEVVRNMIDNQACLFNIDEIGIFLGKVRNAQKRGGASYLEGVFGIIMSAYSKANSRFLLGGDIKRELRKLYVGQLSKAQDDDDQDREAKALAMLDMVDAGLKRPFLSIMGFTTPSTFDGIMDGETATQGFVGRAIIVNERDINPRPRQGFKKVDMPMMMAGRLGVIYGGSEHRVEYEGARRNVHTDDDASEALSVISEWLIGYADYMGESHGEASVAMIRRAYELIAKISFIIAIPEGRRTLEHVIWALAYIKDEIDFKVSLVFANDNAKTAPEAALKARLLNYIDKDNGASVSVLSNRAKIDTPTIEVMMTQLEAEGHARSETSKRKYKGQYVVKWFTA